MSHLLMAYADPPYPGQAKKHYERHKDYAGEVDHRELVDRLVGEYPDGWALSTSVKALPAVLRLCPADVLVHAWVKPLSPPMGDRRFYSWEPVVVRAQRPVLPTQMHHVASPPGFTFRGTPTEHVTGEKPESFCCWLFAAMGLRPSDELHDLFPGSGAVSRAWERWSQAMELSA